MADDAPVRVRFVPSGREVDVTPGTSLFDAARAAGLPVGSSCRGDGVCGRCGLRPVAGGEHLSPTTELERRVCRDNRIDPELRLSCLARVLGPVEVTADYW